MTEPVHTFTEAQLAARDAAITAKALQMAADEVKKVCPVWPPDGPPDLAAAMVNDYLHSAHDAILALQPAPTRWQEVPEGSVVVRAEKLESRTHMESER